MECVICHRHLAITSPERDARVAHLEDGAAFCRRCAAEVNRPGADLPFDHPADVRPARRLAA